jgi:hypothetical protein
MVESKELIFLLKEIKKKILVRNKFFKGLLFFEIVLLYKKNQRTMARDFQKYCFFKNLGLQ